MQKPAAEPVAIGFDEGTWGRYESARFAFSMRLPDGSGWRIDDRKTSFLDATHPATGSRLRARAWNEARAVSREACLARAREIDASLPEAQGESVIDERIETIGGDETSAHLRAAVSADGEGELSGIVLVSGVSVRRCFVLAFETQASGEGAEATIADRLATVTEGVVRSVRFKPMLDVPRADSPQSR